MITDWKPGEIKAFRLFSEWSRAQAVAIFEWDKASVTGSAIGPRPCIVPAPDLQARARAAVA